MFTIITERKPLHLKFFFLQPIFNAPIMVFMAMNYRTGKGWHDMDRKNISELETIISSDYSNMVGIVMLKNGMVEYERYFNNHTPNKAAHVFSVTKSIVSILLGIAIDQGYIRSVDQKVLGFFPGYTVKRGEKKIQHVTLGDLMTMTAPFKYKSAPYTKYFTSDSWVKSSLDLLGGKGVIGQFRYMPLIGPDILSGILASATGRSALQFAVEKLFSYLNRGVWGGKQIVSSAWIDESTTTHSRWDKLAYGYLWWVIDESEHSFAALGDGGTVIYVNPAKNIVVAIASKLKPHAKDRIELIKAYIEPMLEHCGS